MRLTLISLFFASLALSQSASLGLSAAPQHFSPPAPSSAHAALMALPGCGPNPNLRPAAASLVRLEGMGNAKWAGASSNPEAQAWFDYGLTLAHAFQHQDAIAAFQEAQRLDPSCALCVWGEAWGLGPTINFQVDSSVRANASALLQKASVLAAEAPEKTRALIAATKLRAQSGDAKAQDIAFAAAMNALAAKHPQDVELAVLASDAWLIAAYTWSDHRGYPAALALLEGALARRSDDVGAIHFYIHAAEMSQQPAKALAAAQRLAALAPAAAHLLHMPSHIYMRLGRYAEVIRANRDAVKAGLAYAKATKFDGPMGSFPYFTHNLNYGMTAAALSGDAKAALEFADAYPKAHTDFSLLTNWVQFEASKYYVVKGRLASRDDVMALPEPEPPLLRVMWRYARGEAQARSGDAGAVRAEAQQMILKPEDLPAYGDVAFLAKGLAEVARLTLEGRAAMLEKDWAGAIKAYGEAARIDETVLWPYKDPSLWWAAPRRSLAAAYLKAGKPATAKQSAEQVLKTWPNDPAALFVLGLAQSGSGDAAQAKASLQAARAGWAGDPGMLKLDGI